jgi:cytoskeletal protein CcmA (bactofilin family)
VKNISKEFSIIDKDLTIDGTVSTTGRLIVKGVLKGTIIGKNVVIAEEGSVYANAKVDSMTIGGSFEGEIRVMNKLTLLSTGKCAGKVVCKDLVIETGGILNAQVTCLSAEDAGSDM